MGEFEYELHGRNVVIEVSEYEPYEYRGRDEPAQEEYLTFSAWHKGCLVCDDSDSSLKTYRAILARFKELNDLP
jgi:hypothetical protein